MTEDAERERERRVLRKGGNERGVHTSVAASNPDL